MAELKPCPFCGSSASIKHYASKELFRKQKQYSYVQCYGCNIRTELAYTDAEVSHKWNRRAEDGVGVQSKEKKLDICPKCGGELHCDRSAMLTTYPGQFRWECKDCGHFELRSEVLEDGK